jgi:hypothetical protein
LSRPAQARSPRRHDGLAEIAAKAAFAPISITGGVLVDDAMKLFAT